MLTDGERKLTGRVSGVVVCLHQVVRPVFFQIYSGAHRLNIVLQSAYKYSGIDHFFGYLTDSISYYGRKPILTSAQQRKAPKVSETHGKFVDGGRALFRLHDRTSDKFFQANKPVNVLPLIARVPILVADYFASSVAITCKEAAKPWHYNG